MKYLLGLSLLLAMFCFNNVNFYVCACIHACRSLQRTEKGVRLLKMEVTGSCKLNICARNQMLVL